MMKRCFGKILAAMLCLTLALGVLSGFVPGTVSTAKADGVTTFDIKQTPGSNRCTFTVSRSGDISKAQTVRYRTVSLSALEGMHFTGVSGVLTFDAGSEEANTTVVVNETPIGSVNLIYRYQNSTSRKYRFEVLDPGGFRLDYSDRTLEYGSSYKFTNKYVSNSITNLVVFNSQSAGSVTSGLNSGKYMDVAESSSSGKYVMVDDGDDYSKKISVSTSSFFSEVGGSQEYLNAIKDKLYATVWFTQKEEDDGYQ